MVFNNADNERERDGDKVYAWLCDSSSVTGRERDREIERDRDRDRERENLLKLTLL